MSRKDLLCRAAMGAGALVVGSAVGARMGATPAAARIAMPDVQLSRRTYRVAWNGGPCEAPAYAAYAKHLWAREGIDVELYHLGGADAAEAISAGTIDASPGILYYWLKPIERGADVRVTAGLHGGCMRMVASAHAGIKTFMDLRGKTIGTDGSGFARNLFEDALFRSGLNPKTDVRWRVFPPTQLGTALDKGEIQAVAAPDPFSYLLIQQGKAVEIGSNMTGMFANQFCCCVGLSGALVHDDPKAAAALTRGWMNGSRYTGTHLHEVATIEVRDKFVPASVPLIEHLLSSYTWHPSATRVKAQIEQTAHDFKKTGFLEARTDPQKLAARAYVDIFKLAAQAP